VGTQIRMQPSFDSYYASLSVNIFRFDEFVATCAINNSSVVQVCRFDRLPSESR